MGRRIGTPSGHDDQVGDRLRDVPFEGHAPSWCGTERGDRMLEGAFVGWTSGLRAIVNASRLSGFSDARKSVPSQAVVNLSEQSFSLDAYVAVWR